MSLDDSKQNKLIFFERELPELPPENLDKDFADELYKVDWESMKRVSTEFKIWTQIYKLNMTKILCHFGKLEAMFEGYLTSSEVLRNISFLSSWYLVERQFGPIGENRAGRLLYIDNDSVQQVREIYETHVMPYEQEKDRVSYVPGLILEK